MIQEVKIRRRLREFVLRQGSDGGKLLATQWQSEVSNKESMPRPRARPVKEVRRIVRT